MALAAGLLVVLAFWLLRRRGGAEGGATTTTTRCGRGAGWWRGEGREREQQCEGGVRAL